MKTDYKDNPAFLQVWEKGYFDNPTEAASAIWSMQQRIAELEIEKAAVEEQRDKFLAKLEGCLDKYEFVALRDKLDAERKRYNEVFRRPE